MGQSRRVLIVGTCPDQVSALAQFLTMLGHKVESVYDGLSACEAAVTFAPNLVLLGIRLHRIDGFEVAR